MVITWQSRTKGTPFENSANKRKDAARSAGEATARTATMEVEKRPVVEVKKSTY